MNPKAEALKARTKAFALDVLDFLDRISETGSNRRIIWQLSDASTSVGANYRASCRSRSDAKFAAKIGQVLEESDESLFWLEICEARPLGNELPANASSRKPTSWPRSSRPRRTRSEPGWPEISPSRKSSLPNFNLKSEI
jgi:four helix bundle protein